MITVQDWIDILPIVQGQGWHTAGSHIRNRAGQCPLCALVDEVAGTRTGFNISAEPAVHYAELVDSDADMPSVKEIMHAADSTFSEYRLALRHALGMVP